MTAPANHFRGSGANGESGVGTTSPAHASAAMLTGLVDARSTRRLTSPVVTSNDEARTPLVDAVAAEVDGCPHDGDSRRAPTQDGFRLGTTDPAHLGPPVIHLSDDQRE